MLKSGKMSEGKRLVALAGQPNCGKSTVFNAITGASQHVANYPGVTVEKLSGSCSVNGVKVEVVDLPGAYSMTSFSPEEKVTRDFILHEKPETIINVADASSIKRSLYFTLQLIEMELPVVLNLNMMDVALRKGIEIDCEKLGKDLRILVAPTSIKKGTGKKDLMQKIELSLALNEHSNFQVDYGAMESFIEEIEAKIFTLAEFFPYPVRWIAIKLMEGDQDVKKLLNKILPDPDEIYDFAEEKRDQFKKKEDEFAEKH
ncbi:MAG: 50S ribosome-binding GTPase, partial [Desulfobacteraceae bacterium]|nr:50S ribosome-binding GTPase [Desulfobacteraceae bacterium]